MTDPAFAGVAPGTRIMTVAGEVAVERLRPGDRAVAVTAARLVPVRSVRHRAQVSGSAVRIRAGAFGDGRPGRDLHVTPAQLLFVGGTFVAAELLVNGGTIAYAGTYAAVTGPDWLAVELERPDAVLADGMPVGAWGDAVRALQPGPALDALRRQLADIASGRERPPAGPSAPVVLTDEPGIHLLADDLPLWPELSGTVLRFTVPPGCASLRVVSRAAVPALTSPGSTDHRQLGIAVDRLQIDGRTVPLDDPTLTLGWHRPDGAAPRIWRWTSGDAVLPPGRTVEISVAGVTRYEVEPDAGCCPVDH